MYRNADILKIENIQKKYFYLTWKMTGWCNYHCPYCINDIFRQKYNKFTPESEIIEKAKRLNKILLDNNIQLPIKLKLIGGEVCYYNLPTILDEFYRVDKLIVTTNFSQKLDYYYNLYLYCKTRNIDLLLVLSKHEENLQFEEKVKMLTFWCRENNCPEPQISLVVNHNFDFNCLDYYQQNNIKRLKFIVEKLDNTLMDNLSEENRQKLDHYTKLYDSKSKTYKVTFKDGNIEYFSNIYQFLNKLDEGGFIADNYFCDGHINKLTLSYDDILYINKCKVLNKEDVGTIWDDNIKLSNNNTLCNATNKDDPEFRCNLCSSISVWKNI